MWVLTGGSVGGGGGGPPTGEYPVSYLTRFGGTASVNGGSVVRGDTEGECLGRVISYDGSPRWCWS